MVFAAIMVMNLVGCGLVVLFTAVLVLLLLYIFVAAVLVRVLLTCVLSLCCAGFIWFAATWVVGSPVGWVGWVVPFRLFDCCLVCCIRCVFLTALQAFVLLLVRSWFGLVLCWLVCAGA